MMFHIPITAKRVFTFVAAITVFLISCEREINITLDSDPPALVVQGQIETNQPPFVMLTKTMSFFSTIDFGSIQNNYIHDATVQVFDGTKTVTLQEISLDTGNYKFYFYADPTLSMKGQEGTFYTLTIHYNGQTYTSTTKIPYPKGVDTIWAGKPLFSGRNVPAGARVLYVNYTDPDTIGNYVRYFTRRSYDPIYSAGRNAFNDEVINGEPVKQIGLLMGTVDTATGEKDPSDSLRFVYTGDSILLKWSMIDKSVYNFWNTYAFAQQSVGNPFATPINVKSNISGGALGVWAGYGSAIISYKVK